MNGVIAPRSEMTRLVMHVLAGVAEGGVITYREISRAAGVDILDHRHILQSARRILFNDIGAVFDAEQRIGLRRCTDIGKVSGAAAIDRKLRRAAKRGIARLDAVQDFDSLSRDLKTEHQLRKTVFSMHEHLQRAGARKKILDQVTAAQAALPPTVALSLFQKKG